MPTSCTASVRSGTVPSHGRTCSFPRFTERPAVDQRKPMSALLQVEGVTIQYKTSDHVVTATWRVSFNVLQSDRFVILGPSGCGKSTLLKAVGGYIGPVEGSIFLNGTKVVSP